MEHVGYNPAQIHGSIHCKKYNHVLNTERTAITKITDPFDTFHTYTLEWSSQRVQVAVDGFKYFEYRREDYTYESWPFDNSFNIILNTAVGGDWGGAMGIDDTIFPQIYTIDYVRQYAISDLKVKNVSLICKANGKYVSADNYGNSPLVADRDTVREWETFERIDNDDGTVSLRAMANNKYVSATDAGNGPLIAKEAVDNNWELFTLQANSDLTYTFKSKSNGKFVSASGGSLIANKDTIGQWESFYFV